MALTTSLSDLDGTLTKSLEVSLEYQRTQNWCWAAVAAAVVNLKHPARALNQYKVAALVTGNQACGQASPPDTCDVPNDIWQVLDVLGLGYKRFDAPIGWGALTTAIKSRSPVVARLHWPTSGRGHFVVLAGYYAPNQEVAILDPELPPSLVHFAAFPADYRWGSEWTHSYVIDA